MLYGEANANWRNAPCIFLQNSQHFLPLQSPSEVITILFALIHHQGWQKHLFHLLWMNSSSSCPTLDVLRCLVTHCQASTINCTEDVPLWLALWLCSCLLRTCQKTFIFYSQQMTLRITGPSLKLAVITHPLLAFFSHLLVPNTLPSWNPILYFKNS